MKKMKQKMRGRRDNYLFFIICLDNITVKRYNIIERDDNMLEEMLKRKKMSVYQCSKLCGIPYTTMLELIKGKTKLEKCSAETVYKLARVLGVPMEDLIENAMEYRFDFEEFKSNVCHAVKDTGDIDFIISELEHNNIRRYWDKKWYPEAFYLLAMVDYLSRINDIPKCENYNDIRACSLEKPIYPRDVKMSKLMNLSPDIYEKCRSNAIPEFSRFNIMEAEVRNVY